MNELNTLTEQILEKFLFDVLSARKTFPYKTFVNTVYTLYLSFTFAPVRQNVIISSESSYCQQTLYRYTRRKHKA